MTAKNILSIIALLVFAVLATLGAVSTTLAGPAALTPTAEPPTSTATPCVQAAQLPYNGTVPPTATVDFHPTHTPDFHPTATIDFHPPTHTPISTPTDSPLETPTGIPTDVPTATATAIVTATETVTATSVPTDIPTETATSAPTETATDVPTETQTPAPTETVGPTATPCPTETATPVPSETPTPTNTPSGTIPPATPTASPVPTNTPNGTIPPVPDASLMSVRAFCDPANFNVPTWRLENLGGDMAQPRNFWLLQGLGDDNSCLADVIGREPDGSFFLRAGEFIQRPFRNLDFSQPQRICAQRSIGFASAFIGQVGNPCSTGLPNTPEPGLPGIFLPWAGR